MKEMFNANSGLFHFVFANPKEDYYLDSLIKMDMNEYLFYLLKKENYQEVYFVEEKIQKYGSRYVIKMKEETAFDFLEQYNKKTFMGSIKKIVVGGGDGEKKDGFLLTEPLSEEILKGLMKNILEQKEKDCAFVIPVELFYRLFHTQESRDLLSGIAGYKNVNWSEARENGKNILVIQSSLQAVGSQPFLMDPEGIFGTGLFPSIQSLQKQRKIKIYEEMSNLLGQRCMFLGEISRKGIKQMLFRGMLCANYGWISYLERVDDCTDFLYAYCHSEAFRKEMDCGLSGNDCETLKSLSEKLIDQRDIWRKMMLCIDKIRRGADPKRSLLSLIRGSWPLESEKRRVLNNINQPLAERLGRADTQWMYRMAENTDFSRIRAMVNKLYRSREELMVPRNYKMDEEKERQMHGLINSMEKAGENRDLNLFQEIINAFEFGVFGSDTADEESEEGIFEYYLYIVKLTKSIRTLEKEIKGYEDQIQKWEEEKSRRIREISRKEAYDPLHQQFKEEKVSEGVDGALAMAVAEKEAVVNLNRNIENAKMLRAQVAEERVQYKDSIIKFKQVIRSMAGQNTLAIREKMEKAAEDFSHAQIQKIQDLDGIRRAGKDMNETLAAVGGIMKEQMSEKDIDEEFRKIQQDFIKTEQGNHNNTEDRQIVLEN